MATPKKVYIVHAYSKEYHLPHLKKIMDSNPDSIILWCDVEYEAEAIFKLFIEVITDYLESNNKTITILYPGPNRKVTENIFLEKTYGYYIINSNMVIDKNTHLNFDNAHQEADKLYTLYTNRGSPERIRIIDTLAREDMLGEGIVTFHGIYLNTPPVWQYHDGSELSDEDNFTLSSIGEGCPQYFPKSFFKGFVDVVCETRVDNGEFFTTEKTAKSIIALKPFLALSSQHYHRHLMDEYGILPYSEIFDYSFDKCPDISDRIEGIVQNLQRLKLMNKNDVHSRLFDKMVHNKSQFINYGTIRNNMVPKSLDFIFNEPYELLGDVWGTKDWFDFIRKHGWLQ